MINACSISDPLYNVYALSSRRGSLARRSNIVLYHPVHDVQHSDIVQASSHITLPRASVSLIPYMYKPQPSSRPLNNKHPHLHPIHRLHPLRIWRIRHPI